MEDRLGRIIVGDTLEANEFGIQVLRLGKPFGPLIPFRMVYRRGYYKAER